MQTQKSEFDPSIPLPPHHRFATIQANRVEKEGLTLIAFRAGEYTNSDHKPAQWMTDALNSYQASAMGVYESALPASAVKGFAQFYHAVTGTSLPANYGVIFEPGSSTSLTHVMLYLNAIGYVLAIPQSGYASYQAIHTRITGKEAPEYARTFSERGVTISTSSFPKQATAALFNTIGNPGSDHLKNADLASIIKKINANHPDKKAIIILDMAYQGISLPGIPDKFENLESFLKANPDLEGKVEFIQVFSTSKIGGKPNARMSAIVTTPAISSHLSTFTQPLLLGVPEASKKAWEFLDKATIQDQIKEYSQALVKRFHANYTTLVTTLKAQLPNATLLPYEGGMFTAVDIKKEFDARASKKLGNTPSFSTQAFVEKTIKENVVPVDGKQAAVYFTFIPDQEGIRINLGENDARINQLVACLDSALNVYISQLV